MLGGRVPVYTGIWPDVRAAADQGCEGGTTKSLGRLKLRGWRRCRMSIRMFISNPDRQLAAKSSVDCCLVTCCHFLRLLKGTVGAEWSCSYWAIERAVYPNLHNRTEWISFQQDTWLRHP